MDDAGNGFVIARGGTGRSDAAGSDAANPRACPVGEPDWAETYEAHAVRLTGMATLLVGRDDAHDLVADSVMRATASALWPTVDNRGAYLTRTPVNLADDRRGQTARRQSRELRAATRAPEASGTSSIDASTSVERRIVVRNALACLSASQLAVVYVHYWEDWTLDQVAAHLGLGGGTVRRHLSRAKRHLRVVLDSAELERN